MRTEIDFEGASVSSVASCKKEVTRNMRCVKANIERSLAGEAGFDLLDAGLERRHLLLQLGQVAREDLAPQLGNLPVDLVETLVDLGELPSEKLDQLFVLARGHGAMIIPCGGPTQAYRRAWWRGARDGFSKR